MVKLIEDNFEELLKFCERDSFGTRIAACVKAYYKLGNTARFWAQETDGKITAAASWIDGNVTVCADIDNADCAELIYCVRALGFNSLICDYKFLRQIDIEPSSYGAIVSFNGINSVKSGCDGFSYSESDNYREVYDILQRCGFTDIGNYNDWLLDISLRVRREVSKVFLAKCGDVACASASVLFMTDKNAFMGGVGALPEFRNKGIAGELVSDIANKLNVGGKSVTLFCKEPLLNFYSKIGFEKTGDWAILKAEDDKNNE